MPILKTCYKCMQVVDKYKPHKCTTTKRVRNKVVYDTKRWHRLRDYVKTKYYYCARCGSIESLQLHHIYKVDTHIEKAYDIDNVCLLCPKCHTFVDKNCKSGELDFKFDKYSYDYTIG